MEVILCKNDQDYEKFALLFLKNRTNFSDTYSLLDAIGSLYTMIDQTNILLITNRDGETIAACSYSYGTREREFEDSDVIFIDCVLIEKEYQGSIVFARNFLEMIRYISVEHPSAKEVRFYAYGHHHYLQRLYRKFARVIGEQESVFGTQAIFSADFHELLQLLEKINRKKEE